MGKSLERGHILLRQMPEQPLILTLKIEEKSQAFFNGQRQRYFPPERNFLQAHLTLFHQLPEHAVDILNAFKFEAFEMNVIGLMRLGAGLAYQLESLPVQQLHQELKLLFMNDLIPQDRQKFRPHITIQNKVRPEQARKLFTDLQKNFEPFQVSAIGLDLWKYLGGPWQHLQTLLFS